VRSLTEFQHYLHTWNHAYTGRASTAIYQVLRANGVSGTRVLVPANICYAAVLPILYSGNSPAFIDVGSDGNIMLTDVQAARKCRLRAAVVPHMYGNPCQDVGAICEYLRQHGVIVIEDCALAMGAEVGGQMVGTFGDYAVFSFGYSKTIDAGYGGLIVSPRSLEGEERASGELEVYDSSIGDELSLLSQLYRVLRNGRETAFTRHVYRAIPRHYRRCFLFRGTRWHYEMLERKLETLSAIVQERWASLAAYESAMEFPPELSRYCFRDGAVPWRYNVLVSPECKPALIKHLLQRHVPVSDWYPVVARMFGVSRDFPRAAAMEAQILNFPLVGVSEAQIADIANAVNEFWR